MTISPLPPRSLPLFPSILLGFACLLGLAFWYFRHKLGLMSRWRSLQADLRGVYSDPKSASEAPKSRLKQTVRRVIIIFKYITGSLPVDPSKTQPGGPGGDPLNPRHPRQRSGHSY